MTATTLKALKESIQHWERLATGKQRPGEDESGIDCALCALFYKSTGCHGCPVAEKTGRSYCEGTPWWRVGQYEVGTSRFKKYAKVELAFLKSLLPKKRGK